MEQRMLLELFLSISCCCFVSLGMPTGPTPGDRVQTAFDARMYLQHFNHMPTDDMETGEMMGQNEFTAAIESFQSMANLTVTGELDSETMRMMNMPRCGMPDNMGHSNDARRRRKRYSAMNSWGKLDLTWRIVGNGEEDLDPALIHSIMEDALTAWSDVSGLTFTESTAADADILIDFNNGEHGDGNPFDGPGNVLAHAYFPTTNPIGGDAHFDDGETYTHLTNAGINLFQVAVHEYGHSLGLGHSDVEDAIMFAFYRGYVPNFQLHADDVAGIQYLYGQNVEAQPGAPDPTMKPFNPDVCPSQLDTLATTGDGRYFAFIGDATYQLNADGVAEGYPRPISQVFQGLPDNIDASFYYSGNGRTYYFKGDQYWRYSSTTADAGYPRDISAWGIPPDIDAAFVWSGNGRIYFVKDDQYWRYNAYTGEIDRGYPRPMSVWGIPAAKIDAAFQAFNSRTYFFAGDNYYRYNDATFSVDTGYPLPTAFWWFGCGENVVQGDGGTGGGLAACVPHTVAVLLSIILGFVNLLHIL